MEFNLRGFWDVLTWQVNWIEANFFWVFISIVVYLIGIALVWLITAVLREMWLQWFDKQVEKGRSWLAYLLGGIIIFYTIVIIGNLLGYNI
jgi:hypothetical protein